MTKLILALSFLCLPMMGDAIPVPSVESALTTQWIGSPVMRVTFSDGQTRQVFIKDVEFGLRADGTVVWR